MPILQEEFQYDPYRLLVACIMLNQTSNKNVRKVIYSFFEKWPTPESVFNSNLEEIREHIKPLGFYNVRTERIFKFTRDWLTKPFKEAKELYGIGKYANDSYEIFIKGNQKIEPTDKILIRYLRGEFIDQ